MKSVTSLAELRVEAHRVLDEATEKLREAQAVPFVLGMSKRDRHGMIMARTLQVVADANRQILELIDAAAIVELVSANGPTVPRPLGQVLSLDALLQEAQAGRVEVTVLEGSDLGRAVTITTDCGSDDADRS